MIRTLQHERIHWVAVSEAGSGWSRGELLTTGPEAQGGPTWQCSREEWVYLPTSVSKKCSKTARYSTVLRDRVPSLALFGKQRALFVLRHIIGGGGVLQVDTFTAERYSPHWMNWVDTPARRPAARPANKTTPTPQKWHPTPSGNVGGREKPPTKPATIVTLRSSRRCCAHTNMRAGGQPRLPRQAR